VLAETFILECDGTQPATFRLAGTKICENIGRELRGTRFVDLFGDAGRAQVSGLMEDLRLQGAVQVLEAKALLDTQRAAQFEILIMPLVHNGTGVSRMLGSISALDPPHWLGSERLPALDLVRHEHIWPEGRPHALADKFRQRPALIPELASARLVRINRRSFRILDGGLQKE